MATNPGYTRRQELRCTLAELSTYGSVILYEGEVLWVQQSDGTYDIKIGDGETNIATLPYVMQLSVYVQKRNEAAAFAQDSQAWAEGKKGTSDVGSSDPQYHNHAKYHAAAAADSAAAAAASAQEAEDTVEYKYDKRDVFTSDLDLDEEEVEFDLDNTLEKKNIAQMLQTDESETTMLSLTNHAPASHTDDGEKGQIYYDENYLYICVATDTWRRVALSDF